MIGLLRRVEPLSPLVASFVLLGGGLAIRDLVPALVGVAVVLTTLPLLAGRGGVSWLRLVPAVVGFASVTWSNWLLADPHALEPALVAGLRVAFFAVPGVVFAGAVDPSRLGDQLGQRLRLPARPVLALVVGLQQLDTFAQDWATLERSRRVRGLGPSRSPLAQARHYADLTFALLVQAIRRAERMTVAMEARGYARLGEPGHRRTWAQPAPWTRHDTTLVVVAVVLAAVPTLVGTLA